MTEVQDYEYRYRNALHPATWCTCRPRPHGRLCWRLGLRFLFAGLVTSMGNQPAGTDSDGVRSSVGWFQNVLPHERHEDVRGSHRNCRNQ